MRKGRAIITSAILVLCTVGSTAAIVGASAASASSANVVATATSNTLYQS